MRMTYVRNRDGWHGRSREKEPSRLVVRVSMDTLRTYTVLVLCGCLTLCRPVPGQAQSTGIRVTYDKAHLSTADWTGLGGFTASVTFPALLGLNATLGYGRLTADASERDQVCGFAGCTQGPFLQTPTVESFSAGLGREVARGGAAELALSVDVSVVRQRHRLEKVTTGQHFDRNDVSSAAFGGEGILRLTGDVLGIRPLVHVGYRRVLQGSCAADATCYHNRNLLTAGVGLEWRR